MKRAFIQIVLFFFLVAIVMIVRFPYHDYGVGMFDTLRDSLRSQGILLEADDIQFSFPARVEFDNLSVLLPHQKLPLPLHAERALLNPSLTSLLLLRGVLHSNLEAYQGSLDTKLDYSLWGEEVEFELHGKNLQLQEHPVLRANGVSGTLRVDAVGEVQRSPLGSASSSYAQVKKSSVNVVLENAEYSGNYKIKGFIPVPKLQDIRSELLLSHANEKTIIEKFDLFSSLGQLAAKGELRGARAVEELAISGTISLTAEGEKVLGGYLALSAGLSPDTVSRDWSFSLTQTRPNTLPIFKANPR